uniref:Uncharacterized protein n=1 Tax=Lactuca sativa TaxID=4236 RepID=A0A9R1WAW7_LACSA|nr:hypothetical protein LSAT_V11C300147560 [Lactuca sativa]
MANGSNSKFRRQLVKNDSKPSQQLTTRVLWGFYWCMMLLTNHLSTVKTGFATLNNMLQTMLTGFLLGISCNLHGIPHFHPSM